MAGLYCYLAALLLSLASGMLLCIRQETVFGCEVPGIRAQRTAGIVLAAFAVLLSFAGAAAAEGLNGEDRMFLTLIFLVSSIGLETALQNPFRNLRIRRYYRRTAGTMEEVMEHSEKLRILREYVRASGVSSFRIWADGIEGITDFAQRGIWDLGATERYCLGSFFGGTLTWETLPGRKAIQEKGGYVQVTVPESGAAGTEISSGRADTRRRRREEF